MSRHAELAELRNWLRARLDQLVGSIFGWTVVSASSSLGNADQMQSYDDGADPESDTKGQRPVTRVQPFGFQSVPPSGLRGLWLRLGSSNVVFIGIGPTQKYGPQSLNAGESCQYAAKGQEIVLDKNGNITATAASNGTVALSGASSGNGNITLNPTGTGTAQIAGNTHPLPLWDTFLTDLSALCLALSGGLSGTTPIVDHTTGIPLASLITPAATLYSTMAVNGYNSTKAKNG